VKGIKLFDSVQNHGLLTRAKNVLVGDFPELNILDETEEDEL